MKKIVIFIGFLFFSGISLGLYQYNRGPEDLKNQQAEIVLSGTGLKEQLTMDATTESRLRDKVLLVEGVVSSVEKDGAHTAIIIDSVVRGELENSTQVPDAGQKVRLKGKLGGYDEIFEEVVLIKCQLE